MVKDNKNLIKIITGLWIFCTILLTNNYNALANNLEFNITNGSINIEITAYSRTVHYYDSNNVPQSTPFDIDNDEITITGNATNLGHQVVISNNGYIMEEDYPLKINLQNCTIVNSDLDAIVFDDIYTIFSDVQLIGTNNLKTSTVDNGNPTGAIRTTDANNNGSSIVSFNGTGTLNAEGYWGIKLGNIKIFDGIFNLKSNTDIDPAGNVYANSGGITCDIFEFYNGTVNSEGTIGLLISDLFLGTINNYDQYDPEYADYGLLNDNFITITGGNAILNISNTRVGISAGAVYIYQNCIVDIQAAEYGIYSSYSADYYGGDINIVSDNVGIFMEYKGNNFYGGTVNIDGGNLDVQSTGGYLNISGGSINIDPYKIEGVYSGNTSSYAYNNPVNYDGVKYDMEELFLLKVKAPNSDDITNLQIKTENYDDFNGPNYMINAYLEDFDIIHQRPYILKDVHPDSEGYVYLWLPIKLLTELTLTTPTKVTEGNNIVLNTTLAPKNIFLNGVESPTESYITGTITYYHDDGTGEVEIGTQDVTIADTYKYTYTSTNGKLGTNTFRAVYSGDSNFFDSENSSITEVTIAPTVTKGPITSIVPTPTLPVVTPRPTSKTTPTASATTTAIVTQTPSASIVPSETIAPSETVVTSETTAPSDDITESEIPTQAEPINTATPVQTPAPTNNTITENGVTTEVIQVDTVPVPVIKNGVTYNVAPLRFDSTIYLILDSNNIPLGTIKLEEGQTIEDIELFDDITPLGSVFVQLDPEGRVTPIKVNNQIKANPVTGANNFSVIIPSILSISFAVLLFTKKRSISNIKIIYKIIYKISVYESH